MWASTYDQFSSNCTFLIQIITFQAIIIRSRRYHKILITGLKSYDIYGFE